MKVTIARGECINCGSCWDACPAFFEQNKDDSFSQVIAQYRTAENPAEGNAPENLEGCIRDAVDLCPVQIIHSG
jgi:ferredoxin